MHLSDPLGPRSLRRIVRDVGGVHAQVTSAGELQCAVRAPGLAPGATDRGLVRRALVKTWAMRGTLHLIDAGDMALFAAASRTRRHWRRPVWERAFKIKVAEVEAAIDAIADALDGECLTRVELADRVYERMHDDAIDARLRSGWGELLKIVAAHGRLCFGPLRGRNVTFVRPDQWVEGWRDLDPDESIKEVCRRYLASHGPATREEFARWWGFFPPDARRVLEGLGDEVVQVDRSGDRAFLMKRDLKVLRRAAEDSAIRVLGMFDPYTLAGLPHDEVVPKARKDEVYRKGAWVSQVVLRGGRVAGTWIHENKSKSTAVEVRAFGKLTKREKDEATQRLAALAPFVGDAQRIRFT